jgi:hypothetical protein
VKPPQPPVRVIRYNEHDGKPPPGVRAAAPGGREKKPQTAPLFTVRANFDQEGNLFLSPSAGEWPS